MALTRWRAGRPVTSPTVDPPAWAGGTPGVVACRVYRAGVVAAEPAVADARREARRAGGFVWLGLYEPSPTLCAEVAREFDLPRQAADGTAAAPHRPRLDRYDDVLVAVFTTARYVDHEQLTDTSEVVETGDVTVFLGTDFVVTLRRGAHGSLTTLRAALEQAPDMLGAGPPAVLHAVADQVVTDYGRIVEHVQTDIDELEHNVVQPAAMHRPDIGPVYQLKREVLELKHAVIPLKAPLRSLAEGAVRHVSTEQQRRFRDVYDRLERVSDQILRFDELTTTLLTATHNQVAIAQNIDIRRISAYAAIIAVPTAICGIYGMNFDHMPELRQVWGYPAVLALLVMVCTGLYLYFRRKRWL